jgi:putative ABC transport system permease protein
MRISTIAFANLKRRKAKAAFLVIGMAIGIGTAVALFSLSRSIREEIGMQLDQFGANIVVVPQSNSLAVDYGGVTVAGVSFDVHQLHTADARKITEIEYNNRLSVVAPKLLGAVQVEGHDVLLSGVDFENELKLKRWWHIVGQPPASDHDVLLGHNVAAGLSVIDQTSPPMPAGAHDMSAMSSASSVEFKIVRDMIQIAGRDYRVAGVLAQTGGREDGMIFAPLTTVQSILNKPDELSLIEVSALCQNCPVEDIVAQIGQKLPEAKVSAVQQSVRARTETVERLTRFSAAVSAVVLAIGSLMIFTTMMGSVVERTKEIGVMRALGFRKVHIVKGLMIEVAVVSAIGGLIGWLSGVLASRAALPYFSESGAAFDFSPLLALVAITASLAVGAVSSIYPALRASRLDPSEAVRSV